MAQGPLQPARDADDLNQWNRIRLFYGRGKEPSLLRRFERKSCCR
jgi:hypothetical protein